MIYNSNVLNLIKSSDKLSSNNLIVAEWNINKYQKILRYGLYKRHTTTYDVNNEIDGKLYYEYEDGTFKEDSDTEYYSALSSIFQGDRPDPGIVLLQYNSKGLILQNAGDLSPTKFSSASPRFYPYLKDREYDYFNSARKLHDSIDDQDDKVRSGYSDINGNIYNANPFAIYENTFPCNKIVVKVQNYLTLPEIYAIDVLVSNEWIEVFSATDNTNWVNGILEIYFNGTSTWSTTVSRLTDLNEINNPNTQLKQIKGLRFRVQKMTEVPDNTGKQYITGLEIIELSPRIEADLTEYVESCNITSTMSDTGLGLPVGTLVVSTGDISLSNATNQFLISSDAAGYNLLSADVQFRIYQKIYDVANDTTYTIPLKVLYSDSWDLASDFTTKIKCYDKMKLLQNKKAPDLLLYSTEGIKYSAIILMLLDNSGITGYEFKTSKVNEATKEDTDIMSFFCRNEQTLSEVLQDIAVSTQCAIFFDAYDNLNVLTKERVVKNVKNNASLGVDNAGVDFWFVYEEDFAGQDEESYLTDYVSNVVSTSDIKVDPVTDGTINYHSYGIAQEAAARLTNSEFPEELLQDIPFSLVVNSYDPVTRILFSVPEDTQSALGAAALTKNLTNTHIKDAGISIGTTNNPIKALNIQDAIRVLYNTATEEQRSSLVVSLDRFDIATFYPHNGYVMVDGEYIEYNGKLYEIANSGNGQTKKEIFFSQEELKDYTNYEISNNNIRSSTIIPIGLMVNVNFRKKQEIDSGSYQYIITDDGRAMFETKIAKHKVPEDVLGDIKTLKIASDKEARNPNKFKASTVYNFNEVTNWKNVKNSLLIGNKDKNFRKNIGVLYISAPPALHKDRKVSGSSNADILAASANNVSIDEEMPNNDFNPFIYTYTDKDIYIQSIDNDFIEFNPEIISTRMKLVSARGQKKDGEIRRPTMTAIAGLGFAMKLDNDGKFKSGYFIEVESFGSAGQSFDPSSKQRLKRNIRFYKISKNDAGKYIPKVLATARSNIMSVTNIEIPNVQSTVEGVDTVSEIEVRISYKPKQGNNSAKAIFDIYYGGEKINFNKIVDDDADGEEDIFNNSTKVFVFVRGDSKASFDYIFAANSPKNTNKPEFRDISEKEQSIIEEYKSKSGKLSSILKNIFSSSQRIKTDQIVFLDFSNTVREAKVYKPRYELPALTQRLIDISRVNPEYMVRFENNTNYGSSILVTNTSNNPITLQPQSNTPLYVIGAAIEELSNGSLTLKDFFKKTEVTNRKETDFSFNKSIYGEKTFTLDSIFIQRFEQARDLMSWIIKYCSKQRLSLKLETYFNPMIELGDKIKVFSKERGYYQSNSNFGDKTFIVSEIKNELSSGTVKMSITLIEVGE